MTSGTQRASMSMEPSTACSASTLWGIWRVRSASSPGISLTSLVAVSLGGAYASTTITFSVPVTS